ncbi:MAG: hypothetical protein GX906_05870, partial [Clostridiales bacterium]|nr:hypothetical protein [Clostridiales bacterium]
MFEKALSVITIIAVSVIFILYFAIKKKEEKDKYYFIAGSLMLVFGIILYAIGLFYEGSLNTPSKITLFASALMHALQSFAGYFEGEKVLKLMQASPLY